MAEYDSIIWNELKAKINNDFGVAGLMGNLANESGLHPDRVQGDIPYSDYSVNYTSQVDNGTISENDFVHNGPNGGGYGLAQWTYYTRKQGLYNMKVSKGCSIGDVYLACEYLYTELSTGYTGVLEVLQNATSVYEASTKVLTEFERPADQSDAVKQARTDSGQTYYDLYAGGITPPNPYVNPFKSGDRARVTKRYRDNPFYLYPLKNRIGSVYTVDTVIGTTLMCHNDNGIRIVLNEKNVEKVV